MSKGFRCFKCPRRAVAIKDGRSKRKQGAAIFAAAKAGHLAGLKTLVTSTRADVNWICRTDSTRTPLHTACANGHAGCVELLLRHGADPQRYDLNNHLPVTTAVAHGQSGCVDVLLRHGQLRPQPRPQPSRTARSALLHIAAANADPGCLELLLGIKDFASTLEDRNDDGLTPLATAAAAGSTACFNILVAHGAVVGYKNPDSGGTVAHLAAMSDSVACLAAALELLPRLALNQVDTLEHWTPLFWAAEGGAASTTEALLGMGAVIDRRDRAGATALHIAALGGHTEVVQTLLRHGCQVDVLDDASWPPLLYADFNAKQECVLSLFAPKPAQLMQLGYLLSSSTYGDPQEQKNYNAVKSAITSIATVDQYYAVLNDFLREHPALLDGDLSFLLKHQGLVDFENKHQWLQRKLAPRLSWLNAVELTVFRDAPMRSLNTAFQSVPSDALRCGFGIEFYGEPGMALGPTREFLQLLATDVVEPSLGLFTVYDGDGSLAPACCYDELPGGGSGAVSFTNRDRMAHFFDLGRIVGAALTHKLNFRLKLSQPAVLQLLGKPVPHPEMLAAVDADLHSGLMWMTAPENDPADLAETFSADVPLFDPTADGPKTVTVRISSCYSKAALVTRANARAYVQAVSQFRLETSVVKEVRALRDGLHELVGAELLEPFSSAEFLLMLNGCEDIDVQEWRVETEYQGYTAGDEVIGWFWDLVASLTEKERAQLLLFATGTTGVPAGGFSQLRGLGGGGKRFTITRGVNVDALPSASTCFNQLKLPPYSSADTLRQKVLIAVRHGSEGFSFS